MDMGQTEPAADLSTQEPRKFSGLLPSSLESLTPRPTDESLNEKLENERKNRLKEAVLRKVTEAEQTLLKRIQVTVPRRFDERANMNTLYPLLSLAGKKAMDYCQRWIEAPTKLSGPLLMGKSGTFKTHLIWATAREMHARAKASICERAAAVLALTNEAIDAGDLISASSFHVSASEFNTVDLVVTDGAQIAHDVRSSVERRNLDEVVEKYRQFGKEPAAAAIFVDDIEVMKLSDWLHEELYRIFDYRYQERMPTLVATNLSNEELRSHLGDRIARRIMDMTEPFKL
jgi:DNA replication protein DnaC